MLVGQTVTQISLFLLIPPTFLHAEEPPLMHHITIEDLAESLPDEAITVVFDIDDEFSVRKWIAEELIALHKSRGDRIYFVTKRVFTGTERITEMFRREFDLPADSSTVIFTNHESKAEVFKTIKAQLSYGDSDRDIRDSIQAGARPIRVLRRG